MLTDFDDFYVGVLIENDPEWLGPIGILHFMPNGVATRPIKRLSESRLAETFVDD